MFNPLLFGMFIGYIVSLLIGFSIKRNSKEETEKYYQNVSFFLLLGILLLFLLTSTLLLVLQEFISWFSYVFLLHLLFMIYFFVRYNKNTRCWKQHRMVVYNFLAIPIIYLSALVLEQPFLVLGVLVIYTYTVFEFQFAKFNPKKPFLWD